MTFLLKSMLTRAFYDRVTFLRRSHRGPENDSQQAVNTATERWETTANSHRVTARVVEFLLTSTILAAFRSLAWSLLRIRMRLGE